LISLPKSLGRGSPFIWMVSPCLWTDPCIQTTAFDTRNCDVLLSSRAFESSQELVKDRGRSERFGFLGSDESNGTVRRVSLLEDQVGCDDGRTPTHASVAMNQDAFASLLKCSVHQVDNMRYMFLEHIHPVRAVIDRNPIGRDIPGKIRTDVSSAIDDQTDIIACHKVWIVCRIVSTDPDPWKDSFWGKHVVCCTTLDI